MVRTACSEHLSLRLDLYGGSDAGDRADALVGEMTDRSIGVEPCEKYSDDLEQAITYENQMLYRMVHEEPFHVDSNKISGKLIAIGRIYSASPERGVSPTYNGKCSFFE